MDPISIAPIAISAWNLIAPLAKKYGPKLLEKTAENLPDVAGKVWDMVKEKMEQNPSTSSLPQELAQAPDDATLQGAFQYQLKKLLENDEAFAKQLDALAKEAGKASQSINVKVSGGGAAAVGNNAKAAGKGGVIVDGNVSGNIVTGNNNQVNTSKPSKKGKR